MNEELGPKKHHLQSSQPAQWVNTQKAGIYLEAPHLEGDLSSVTHDRPVTRVSQIHPALPSICCMALFLGAAQVFF